MTLKKLLMVTCLVVFVLLTSIYLFLLFQVGVAANKDTKKASDVIFVPGAKAYHGEIYNPCLVSRMTHAIELYKEKYASKILVSGGIDKEDNVNEAETMRKIAIDNGVPPENILVEKSATSTYENFSYAKEILDREGLQSVIIVTEPFHIARSALVAKKLGYNYSLSPAISPCWTRYKYFSRYFLKEPITILMYKLQNKL